MFEFDMQHVAGGKRQVYYDDRIETSKEYCQCMSLTCGMWQAASGKYIMMLAYRYTKKKIFSKFKFGMRHAASGQFIIMIVMRHQKKLL